MLYAFQYLYPVGLEIHLWKCTIDFLLSVENGIGISVRLLKYIPL